MPIDFEAEFGVNAGYVELLFAEWREDPESVDAQWRSLFERLDQISGVQTQELADLSAGASSAVRLLTRGKGAPGGVQSHASAEPASADGGADGAQCLSDEHERAPYMSRIERKLAQQSLNGLLSEQKCTGK